MRPLSRLLRNADSMLLIVLLIVSSGLWLVRVQGSARVALDPFGNADQYNYFYPLQRMVAERWAHGKLPLWNPQQLAGVPLLATPQAGAFYLPNLLHLWLPSERALETLAFAHLCWAAWLTFALCRSLGTRPEAAAVGGVSYAWSSYVVGCHLWPPCLAALAWFPLPLLGIARLPASPRCGVLCLASGVAALLVCGHFPLALYGLQAAAAYAMYSVADTLRQRGARAAVGCAGHLTLGALAGVLLAAPQWLPTLELVQHATRNPSGLTPQQIEPFGPIAGAAIHALFSPAVRGSGYTAALSLLLWPWSVVLCRGQQRRAALFFAALALGFALLSLGSRTPLYALYTKLPGTGLFRGPSRALCVFVLGAAVSSALCLDAVLAAQAPRRGPSWCVPLLVSLSGAGLCALQLPASASALIGSALALGALIMLTERIGEPARRVALAAISCGVVLDLALVPATPDRQIWRAGALATLSELAVPYGKLAAQLGSARCVIQPNRKHALATAPRVAALHGLHVFEDYEPLSLQRYADYNAFMQRGQLYDPHDPVLMYAGGLKRDAPWLYPRLLTAAGVKAIARVRPQRGAALELDVTWLPDALPRTYIVHDVRPAQSPQSTLRALARAELGRNAIALEGLDAPLINPAPRSGDNELDLERARLVHDEPERVVVEATLASPGALVLLDASYPGWQARVDGKPVRLYTANQLFRAVLLPAGKHRVSFEYASTRVLQGVGLLVIGLGLLLCHARRAKPRARSARPNMLQGASQQHPEHTA